MRSLSCYICIYVKLCVSLALSRLLDDGVCVPGWVHEGVRVSDKNLVNRVTVSYGTSNADARAEHKVRSVSTCVMWR